MMKKHCSNCSPPTTSVVAFNWGPRTTGGCVGQSPGSLPGLTVPRKGKRALVARALKVMDNMVVALQVVGRGQVRESLPGTENLSLGRLAAETIGMQWRKGGPKVGSTQNLMALAMVVIGGEGWHKAVALVARALEAMANQVMVKALVKALVVVKSLAGQVMGVQVVKSLAVKVVLRAL